MTREEAIIRLKDFVERAESGIPEDRWTRGANGTREIAHSCHIVLGMLQEYADATEAMLAEREALSEASMEVSKDPCRTSARNHHSPPS